MKVLILAIPLLALQGCVGLFEQRVIVARPAVPVILAEDVSSVKVLVRVTDTQWEQAYCDLHAGQLIMADPLDYPAELINKNAKVISESQNFKPTK